MARVKKENTLAERLREQANKLWCACECDGRGCVVCISIDVMNEAAIKLELINGNR